MTIAGMTISMPVFWLVLAVALTIIEVIVPGLISIFFAFGALAAMVATALHAPFWLQLVWFFVLSIASLALMRPFVRKYVNSKVTATNANSAIGREALVKETIDNLHATGAVSLDGRIWTARTEADAPVIDAGKIVRVLRIEGVKLIVEPAPDREDVNEKDA